MGEKYHLRTWFHSFDNREKGNVRASVSCEYVYVDDWEFDVQCEQDE